MHNDRDPVGASLAVTRLVFGTFGFAFAGIGLTVLGFLWLTPFNQFGSPPLVFRIFGSFIALVFVVMGGSTLFGAIVGGEALRQAALRKQNLEQGDALRPTAANSTVNYTCTKCGAQLGKEAKVSPLGDVLCPFCNQWFNIHRNTKDE